MIYATDNFLAIGDVLLAAIVDDDVEGKGRVSLVLKRRNTTIHLHSVIETEFVELVGSCEPERTILPAPLYGLIVSITDSCSIYALGDEGGLFGLGIVCLDELNLWQSVLRNKYHTNKSSFYSSREIALSERHHTALAHLRGF